MRNNHKKLKAFSLVEILIAIAIFSIIMFSTIYFAIDARRGLQNSRQRIEASTQIENSFKLINLYRNNNWGQLKSLTDQGVKGISLNGNQIEVVNEPVTTSDITTSFQVVRAYRDGLGNLAETGTEDVHTRKIIFNAVWNDFTVTPHTIEIIHYINDWNTLQWSDTAQADFDAGTFDNTNSTNVAGGEVSLNSVFYPDWCNPSLALNEYNIPGDASARSVFARPGYAYLGTRGETTGEPFTKLVIEGVDPPTLTVEGTFAGYTVNDIFIEGNYAFLATTNDTKEVVILDISHTPYLEVGSFDASGTSNANSVFVSGTVGYVAQGRYIRTFDLSSYNGARTAIGSITVAWLLGTVSKIAVYQNYIYAVLHNDWYELSIVNATNPASLSITSQTSVNNQQVYDMFLSEDGNRVYFGTNYSSSEKEFFILDTTTKTGARPILGSIDTGTTTIRGIAVVAEGDVAVLVGSNGEEYQVYNISNEASPSRCGGLEVNTGIYDIDAGYDPEGNAFAYIVTGDNTSEFKIIRGGPGGGSGNGYGYLPSGTFTSRIFDSTLVNPSFYNFSWVADMPSGTTLQMQARASDDASLSGAVFIGPDNTNATFFTNSAGNQLPALLQAKQYFQYRFYFTSNFASTPLLNETYLDYQ